MLQRLLAALALVLIAGACSDSPNSLQLRGGVQVSFSTRAATTAAPAPARAPGAALDDTLASGADTLVITQAAIVLRQIGLKTVETLACDVEPEPEGCEDLELGPVLVSLPLTPGAETLIEVEIPAGTYERIDFEVHKVSGSDQVDSAFVAAHPEFADLSIRVLGTYNHTAFTFESDLDVGQELVIDPPLVVNDSVPTNVTIRVDLSTWFRTAAGALIDPATANKGQPNESVVMENIKTSLKAFEDKDRDGDELDEG